MKTTPAFTEKELVKKLQSGDYVAFQILYDQFAKDILLRLKSLVHNYSAVEELHQDVFLKIWEQREKLNPDISFLSILMRLSKSTAYNYYGKTLCDQKMKSYFESKATELYDQLGDLIEFKETNQALNEAISKLPPQRQKVFRLCKLEGKSYEFAAQTFGCSVSTIKDHMAKSIVFLKDELTKHDPTLLRVLLAILLLR